MKKMHIKKIFNKCILIKDFFDENPIRIKNIDEENKVEFVYQDITYKTDLENIKNKYYIELYDGICNSRYNLE
jgi:hypothetical protein